MRTIDNNDHGRPEAWAFIGLIAGLVIGYLIGAITIITLFR